MYVFTYTDLSPSIGNGRLLTLRRVASRRVDLVRRNWNSLEVDNYHRIFGDSNYSEVINFLAAVGRVESFFPLRLLLSEQM